MRTISFPYGAEVPVLGQGTWMMGEERSKRAAEIAALRAGFDLGMTLIDTAEMYGDGVSERLVGEVIGGRRDEVFLVSKAFPQNASSRRFPQPCEASLKRLGTDWLDLYLLHWRGACRSPRRPKRLSGLSRRARLDAEASAISTSTT